MNLAQMLLMARPMNAYQQIILADKPVAFWPLNAQTQNTDIANGINFSGSGLYTGPSLYTGGGASLNTMTQAANLQAPYSPFALQEFSIEFWTNTTTTSNLVILENNENNGFSVQTALLSSGSTSPANAIGINTGNSPPPYASTGVLQSGVNYVCMTYSSNSYSVSAFLNGTLVANVTLGATPFYSASSYLNLGSRNGSYCAPMYIAGLAIYNTVLTATQILNHYNAGIGQ